MSYRVLARRWRPTCFDDLVGQEHVVRALGNALEQDRLHHACLFTGTRGVGKTTLARILARCLNCAKGVSASPCGECSACRSIDEGRFVDLLEVDAASRARVDETRELMDSVPYVPTSGRYKVYLIDEVHMFSNHSFNALLKVLEEPPDHVKFLLATTEPKRIPVTVLSRCLQFNLRRLTLAQIAGQLERILNSEQVPFDANAVQLLAAAAQGSMRDALSLLDQAISDGGGELREVPLRAMLGTVEDANMEALLNAIIARDGPALLAESERIADLQVDPSGVLSSMLNLLQRIALAQAAGNSKRKPAPDSVPDFATRLSPEEVQLLYQIALNGRRDLPLCPNPLGGLEMCLIRMLAFRPGGTDPATAPPPQRSATTTSVAADQAAPTPQRSATTTSAAADQATAPPPQRSATTTSVAADQAAPTPQRSATTTSAVADQATPAPQRSATTTSAVADQATPTPQRSATTTSAVADQAAPPPQRSATTTSAVADQAAPAPQRSATTTSAAADQATPAATPMPDTLHTWWHDTVGRLQLSQATRQVALNCAPVEKTATRLRLALGPDKQALLNDQRKQQLQQALQELLKEALQLEFDTQSPKQKTPAEHQQEQQQARQQQALRLIEEDPHVQKLQEQYQAQIQPGSADLIKPGT